MSSTLQNNFSDNLSLIKDELSKYDGLTRVELFNECINNKLKNTLYKYNVETEHMSDFLLQQEGIRVLKAITKIQKFDDKEIIYANMKGNIDDKYSE